MDKIEHMAGSKSYNKDRTQREVTVIWSSISRFNTQDDSEFRFLFFFVILLYISFFFYFICCIAT